ncbi:hypothetical protein N177_3450 [Lutibaculum baratangense AMV1]|uniref:Uncharacterized protein n=1 Tax=Lutibaculum baratangense AMV1 TaxID=631454 RepID=V4QUH8_9HYPH|nr:hypothetical protein N177_3450 [Lutibaculum baratangense AMV1]
MCHLASLKPVVAIPWACRCRHRRKMSVAVAPMEPHAKRGSGRHRCRHRWSEGASRSVSGCGAAGNQLRCRPLAPPGAASSHWHDHAGRATASRARPALAPHTHRSSRTSSSWPTSCR